MTGTVGTASDWSQRLVESLVQNGVIDAHFGQQILDQSALSGIPAAVLLARSGAVHPTTALQYLAAISGVNAVDLATAPPAFSAASAIPPALARRHAALGYRLDQGGLVLACAEPLAGAQLDEIAALARREVAGILLADPELIERFTCELEGSAPGQAAQPATAQQAQPAPTGGSGASSMAVPALGDDFDFANELNLDLEHLLGGLDHERPLPPGFRPPPGEAPTSFLSSMGRELSNLEIDDLLTYAVQVGASDLHLADRLPPAIRVNGSIRKIDGLPPLTNDQLRAMLYNILPQAARERFEGSKELDTSHAIHGVGRFRVNVFQQRGSVGAVLRMIPQEIPDFQTLGLPPQVLSLAELRRGLVLVTGPTGSGKSTTLASIIGTINQTKPLHIMTVEDPIEFLHGHGRAIVNQREVGVDTSSFAECLRHVLRQDPDVILVGEMRDLETIQTALTAAETGHLVFATLHTQDAPSTIDRVIDVFPTNQQEQIRIQLASTLEAVVTQQLVLNAAGDGRVPVAEVMMCTAAIKNLIRSAKTHQIFSLMQTGADFGMQTMDQGLARAVRAGLITEAMAYDRCHSPNELRDHLAR
jgi:twitching motility protein PilT